MSRRESQLYSPASSAATDSSLNLISTIREEIPAAGEVNPHAQFQFSLRSRENSPVQRKSPFVSSAKNNDLGNKSPFASPPKPLHQVKEKEMVRTENSRMLAREIYKSLSHSSITRLSGSGFNIVEVLSELSEIRLKDILFKRKMDMLNDLLEIKREWQIANGISAHSTAPRNVTASAKSPKSKSPFAKKNKSPSRSGGSSSKSSKSPFTKNMLKNSVLDPEAIIGRAGRSVAKERRAEVGKLAPMAYGFVLPKTFETGSISIPDYEPPQQSAYAKLLMRAPGEIERNMIDNRYGKKNVSEGNVYSSSGMGINIEKLKNSAKRSRAGEEDSNTYTLAELRALAGIYGIPVNTKKDLIVRRLLESISDN